MKLTNNTDFFQKSSSTAVSKNKTIKVETTVQPISGSELKKACQPRISPSVIALVKETAGILTKCGLNAMATRVERVLQDVSKDRFTISVVGEFSRGKSTFLNNLLDNAACLPTGNLPTTAVMTRIRYAHKPQMAVFDENGTRVAMHDVSSESWNGLIANNFGEKQPRGSVIVGIPNKWLGLNCIEIIDSPGAGDMSEERTVQIADTLDRTDGAIINISATSPLSLTEREFILQRILKRKTPFSIVIVNKLDLIPFEQRNGVVQYIRELLKINKMDIPVYIPSDVEMPDSTFDNIKGLDKVKSAIEGWANDPRRQALTDVWVKTRVQDVVFMAIDTLEEQQKLYEIDNDKFADVIRNKKAALDKLEIMWNDIENDFLGRARKCYEKLSQNVKEETSTIVERLQYEAVHASSPEKWWNEDYPYRLKVELANLSIGIDNTISKIIAFDAKWLNQVLDQKFKTYVQVGSTSIANKKDYISEKTAQKIDFENLNRMQNIAKLGTTALSIGAYFTPLKFVGSMSFGAVGGILQGTFLKKKLEEQKSVLKKNIASDVPKIIDRAVVKSEDRIYLLYNSIVAESSKKKELWKEAQTLAIASENKPRNVGELEPVRNNIATLRNVLNKLN